MTTTTHLTEAERLAALSALLQEVTELVGSVRELLQQAGDRNPVTIVAAETLAAAGWRADYGIGLADGTFNPDVIGDPLAWSLRGSTRAALKLYAIPSASQEGGAA